MARPPFDWNDIPLLLALAQAGSIRGAARLATVDPATVSRRLLAAEARLGTRLFERGRQGYEPTTAGRVVLRHAEQAYGEVQAMRQSARQTGDPVSGLVRVTAVDVVLDEVLLPALPAFLREHPGLQLELVANNGNLSFTRREADLALRLARPAAEAGVLARRLGGVDFAVYGALGRPVQARGRWPGLAWLAYGEDLAHVPEMQWLEALQPSAPPRLRISAVGSLRRACAAGLGLALLPVFAAEGGGLLRWSAQPELTREVWLLRHRDTARQRRFRLVAEWMDAMLTHRLSAPLSQ